MLLYSVLGAFEKHTTPLLLAPLAVTLLLHVQAAGAGV
jgi:hypothetical protein